MANEIDILHKTLKTSLENSGWTFDSHYSGRYNATAILNQIINMDIIDCVLYIDNKAVAIIEIKNNYPNTILKGLEHAKNVASKYFYGPVPFIFIYTGEKIIFQDLKDSNSNPKEIKRFYNPDDLIKMFDTIPYGPSNVTKNIEIFLNYLKLAIILIYINCSNYKVREHFTSRFSEDKFYSINKKEFGIKRVLKFAYFLFAEIYLTNPQNDIFNINNKRLNSINIEDFTSCEIKLHDKSSEILAITQGQRIYKEKNKIIINYSGSLIRDTESYAIPVYDRFRNTDETLIKFGESTIQQTDGKIINA